MSPKNHSIGYDDLPFWSAPFGIALLDKVTMKANMNVLDIGSGSGFPMLELAERLGKSCMVYGLDPSGDAIRMINEKKTVRRIENTRVIKGFAEEIPFPDGYFNLVVANNGINNVTDQEKTLSECRRVSDREAQMLITVNLPRTMIEFYDIFKHTLIEKGLNEEVQKMYDHIHNKRKSVEYLKELIEKSGFLIKTVDVDGFKIRFTDGTAFFNHSLIRNAFMGPWKAILPEISIEPVFSLLEQRLNEEATRKGGLIVSVPFACFDCSVE